VGRGEAEEPEMESFISPRETSGFAALSQVLKIIGDAKGSFRAILCFQ
jgi:hypothetical protein